MGTKTGTRSVVPDFTLPLITVGLAFLLRLLT